MRNRKLIFAAIFAMGITTFHACIEDPEPAPLDAISDVFVQKIVQDGQEKYGLTLWVYGNKELKSASVEGPNDETWTLTEDATSSYVYSLFPDTEEYTDSMPASGDYLFTVTSMQEGEAPVTAVDKLETNELGTVTIDSTQFTASKLKTTWLEVEDADAYIVRLYNASDELIYISPTIASNKTEYSFGNTDQGWLNATDRADVGEPYRVEVLAVLYETNSTSANQGYNFQFLSAASKDITWGE